jgi:hypothetical protein
MVLRHFLQHPLSNNNKNNAIMTRTQKLQRLARWSEIIEREIKETRTVSNAAMSDEQCFNAMFPDLAFTCRKNARRRLNTVHRIERYIRVQIALLGVMHSDILV